MTYVRVEWRHSFPTEPVTIYSEFDAHRWEVRKVEVFPDGSFGYASKSAETPSTGLGLVPFPPLAEIAEDPAFEPVEITADEFDKAWRAALDARMTRRAFLSKAFVSVLLSSSLSSVSIFLRDLIFDSHAGRRPTGALELVIPFFLFGVLLVGAAYLLASAFGARPTSARAARASGLVAGLAGFGMVFDLWFPAGGLITLVGATALTPICLGYLRPR